MNLQLHLLSRIAVLALLCLLVIAGYSLFQSHNQAEQNTRQMAEAIGKQLESQQLLIDAGIGLSNPFPDFEFWKHLSVAFQSRIANSTAHSLERPNPWLADGDAQRRVGDCRCMGQDA